MIRSALTLTATTALALGAAAGPASAAPPADRGNGAQVHRVDLDELNGSGVDGTVTLVQRGDQLRVVVNATGLVPGVEHPQHVHGFSDEPAVCPTPEDGGADGVVSLAEGGEYYGGILLGLDATRATPSGVLSYTESFTLDDDDLLDLSDEAVVLHGGFAEGEYVPVLPVACGTVS